jgi:tetratricopeptide (TPR) repeat protein
MASPKILLVISEDSSKSNIDHIQKNTKRQTCKTALCEKWMEENLELELRVSGSIEPVQNQIRLTLRLHNPQTKTLLQTKEGIFPEDQFEFQTNEMVKALFTKGYSPNKPPKEATFQFSFPNVAIESENPDLRIFSPPTDSEKINELLLTLEKKVLRADAKFREGDYETALTIYDYVLEKLTQSLNYIELRSITEYNESITKRKTSALLKNIEKNIKALDQRVRQDKQDSDKLLDYLQTYNSFLKDVHSNGVNNPEVLDGLLSRISKLEYLVLSSYEKRAEQHEYYGRYPEGLKDLEKLKNIILSNSNLKNLAEYIKKIDQKIKRNKNNFREFSTNSLKTLYYIAEKESFNRAMKQNIGDGIAATGAEEQMRLCLAKGDLILAQNNSENEEAYAYYIKIQELFKKKENPTIASTVPKRNSVYLVDYSKLWYSFYFPGLGQRLALPDEKNSSTLFYTGILTFAHVLYRANLDYAARRTYETTDRVDPLILSQLDSQTRSQIISSETTKFNSLRQDIDTTQQNLNYSLGLFGLVYIISLGDAAYSYYKGTKISIHNPTSLPIGNGNMDIQITFQPTDSRAGISYTPGEFRYGLQYTQNF